MSKETYWVTIWSLVATTLIIIVLTTSHYYTHKNNIELAAIKSGQSSLAVYCLYEQTTTIGDLCKEVLHK